MKAKFLAWAREQRVPTHEDWTIEQICDSIVEAGAPWPPDLVNEEGWQLWTAVMRRELAIASIMWDEVVGEDAIQVVFRLNDKRDFSVSMEKAAFRTKDFGEICKSLELQVREWKAKDDRRVEHALAEQDEEWGKVVPDLMDYVIGFRAWNLSGNRLKPIAAGNDVWRGGAEVRASCGHGKLHRAPAHECDCGFYAWHDFTPMKEEARGGGTRKVWGAVQACGRMEVHEDGFRAEYMRPVLFGYDDRADEMTVDGLKRGPDYDRVFAIAEQLGGVQVVPYDILPEAAKEFGLLIEDSSLKPSGSDVEDR